MKRLSWLALALILFAFVPALSQPGVLRAPLPKLSDGTTATHPWHVFWRDEVREGRAPLWNPFVFAGMPAYGEPQMQTVYPGNALWLIAPADAALKWSLVLHLLLGAWGAYRLTRELGATRAGGALAALVFGLQGQHLVFAFGGWTQVIAPIAWAPWILWQLTCACARPGRAGWRAAALAGVGLGLQLLSGHPEWVRYTLIAGAILTLVGRGADVGLRDRLARAAIALLIGVLVGLPQLGPTAQAAMRSSRGQAALAGGPQLAGASYPPETLPTVVVPRLFGPWDLTVSTDGLAHKARQAPISFGESLVYVGVLPLLLAFAGARAGSGGRDRSATGFVVVGLVGLVFACNDLTRAQDMLDTLIPADAVFRSPARFTFLVNFALVVLAALGWSRLERGAEGTARRLAAVAWGMAAMLGVGAGVVWVFREAIADQIASRIPVPGTLTGRPELADGIPAFLQWALASASIETAIAAGLAITAAVMLRRMVVRPSIPWLPVALLLVVAIDLCLFARPFLSSVVPLDDVYREDLAVLSALPEPGARFIRVSPDLLPSGENTAILARTRSVGGYDLFVLEEWARLSRTLATGGDAALAAAGVTHRLVRPEAGVPEFTEVPGRRGRAWWASRAVVAPDADAAAGWLARVADDPVVALEAIPDAEPGATAGVTTDSPGAAAAIEILHDVPGRFEARVTADQAGWIVFTEVFYPGWRASVDDAPVQVHRAFGIFQAVPVPAGSRVVVITHRPTVWPFFAAALAGLVVAGVIARRPSAAPSPAN